MNNSIDRNDYTTISVEDWFALVKDAARYRWLREHSCQHDSAGNVAESWSTHADPTSLDRAVDEAMNANVIETTK
jgi:hypothetical protein